MKKPDRHKEPESVVFPARFPATHIALVGKIAADEDKTKGAILRVALAEYLKKWRAK